MRTPREGLYRPKNFRTHKFNLFGRDIQIGGMASPDKNGFHQDQAMQYLKKEEDVKVIIGLREQSYQDLAERNGIEYHHLPIEDFTQAPVKTYDTLYQQVKEATEQGKKVTIHCGAGDGRTGTALASLKLREVMLEAALKDPSILDKKSKKTAIIDLPYSGIDKQPCTPFVMEAVNLTRQQRVVDPNNPSDDSGHHSVETPGDIKALMRYEKHLIAQIKNELRIRDELKKTPQERFNTVLIDLQNIGRQLPNEKIFLDELHQALNKAQQEFFSCNIDKTSFNKFKNNCEELLSKAETHFNKNNSKIWYNHVKPVLKGILGVIVGVAAVLVTAGLILRSEAITDSYKDTFFKSPETVTNRFKQKLSELKQEHGVISQIEKTLKEEVPESGRSFKGG